MGAPEQARALWTFTHKAGVWGTIPRKRGVSSKSDCSGRMLGRAVTGFPSCATRLDPELLRLQLPWHPQRSPPFSSGSGPLRLLTHSPICAPLTLRLLGCLCVHANSMAAKRSPVPTKTASTLHISMRMRCVTMEPSGVPGGKRPAAGPPDPQLAEASRPGNRLALPCTASGGSACRGPPCLPVAARPK